MKRTAVGLTRVSTSYSNINQDVDTRVKPAHDCGVL
jgi:hypothetical protein